MRRAALVEPTLRLGAAAALLLALAWMAGDHYLRACLPLYRAVLQLTLPGGLALEGPALRVNNGERTIALGVIARQHLSFAGRVAPPGGRIDASTLAGHALQHPVLIGALVLAWPALGCRRAVAIAVALPLLAIVEALDIPLVLRGAVEDAILAGAGADPASSALVRWMTFMNSGGRIALSLAAGLIAVGAAHGAWRRAVPPPAPAHPTPEASGYPHPIRRPADPSARERRP